MDQVDQLADAIDNRDCAKIVQLTEQGLDLKSGSVSIPGISGMIWTPLIWACRFGRHDSIPVILCLIHHGANVNEQARFTGQTPLHFACREGNLEIAKLLVEHGADLCLAESHGATPLLEACSSHGNLDVVRLLIRHGANVNVGGGMSLHFCSKYGRTDTVKELLAAGANILAKDDEGFTANLRARESWLSQNIELAQALEKTMTLIQACRDQNDKELIKSLCWQSNIFVHVTVPRGVRDSNNNATCDKQSVFSLVCHQQIYEAMIALVHKGADLEFSPGKRQRDGEDVSNNYRYDVDNKTSNARHWHVPLVQLFLQKNSEQLSNVIHQNIKRHHSNDMECVKKQRLLR